MNALIAIAAALLVLQDAPRVETHGSRRVITNNARPAASATRNVLIIGNSLSYFNEIPWMLEQVARSKKAQPALHVEFSGGSGLTLEQHWKMGKALRRIDEERWDFVVLQAQSTEAVRAPAVFEEFAQRFDAAIRARHAHTVILETWAPRDARYPQRAFNEEYEKVAHRLGATLAPVGTAWSSLLASGLKLYEDDVHPNVAGSYLAACVLYAIAYADSPSGAIYRFDVHYDIREFYRRSLEEDSIDEPKAAAIQSAAWSVAAPSSARR